MAPPNAKEQKTTGYGVTTYCTNEMDYVMKNLLFLVSAEPRKQHVYSVMTMFRYYFCVFFLVLTKTVTINADDDPFAPKKNENDDPFAPKNENDDPFASDPFASSEPNPWDKYPWDVTHAISHATGALSTVGSAWIILEILLDKKKRRLSYHRIMLGLSLYDCASSFWLFIGVWVNQNRRGFTDTAQSSNGWCETSGFIIYLGSICIPMYNAALAIYFWIAIKQGWKEERIVKTYERYVHGVIFICGILPAVAALILNLYNPWYNYCFATYSGEGRGTVKQSNVFLGLSWAIVFASTLVVTATMVSIYISVYTIHKKIQKFSFRRCEDHESVLPSRVTMGGSSALNVERCSSNSAERSAFNVRSSITALKRSSSAFFQTRTDNNNNETNRIQRKRRSRGLNPQEISARKRQDRTRRVRTIALLYTIPFFATWVVSCVFFVMNTVSWNTGRKGWITPRSAFVMNTYIATALPLQGFINWFIYMLPRFQRLRKEHPSWSLKKILIGVVGRMFSRKSSESISKREKQQQQKIQQHPRSCDNDNRIVHEAEQKDEMNTTSHNQLCRQKDECNKQNDKNNDDGENGDSTYKIYDIDEDNNDDESMIASMFYANDTFDIDVGETQLDQSDSNTRRTIRFDYESSTSISRIYSGLIQESSCSKDMNASTASQLDGIDEEIQNAATAVIRNLDLICNEDNTGEFTSGEQTVHA